MPALTGSRKIAVLLCNFTDTAQTQPHPPGHYEDLFVNVGTGGLNDYWRDVSYGKVNTDGSKVFGWNTVPSTLAQYVLDHPGRWDKISGAFAAFPAYKPADFNHVVAIFNADVGDESAAGGVLAIAGRDDLTFLAHETGHLFGLEHSFDESDRKLVTWSAPGEYYDSHDIMSARNVFGMPTPRFGSAGPRAAAPHLDRLGWLDRDRVWRPESENSSFLRTLDLVALGHPEVPGYLAAKIDDLYVEFRTRDGFDAGIPRPTVLIHSLRDPNPVALTTDRTTWNNEWLPGMTYPTPRAGTTGPHLPGVDELFGGGGVTIEVLQIDPAAMKARIQLRKTASRRPPVVGGGIPIGGWNVVGSDGGGWVILPSGKLIRIPPRSPLLALVSKLALVTEAQAILEADSFAAVQLLILDETQTDLKRMHAEAKASQRKGGDQGTS